MNAIAKIAVVLALAASATSTAPAETKDDDPFDQRPQPWQRQAEPILSARTTTEDWCKVVCYSPHVIFHDGKFRMWYLGTSGPTRQNDIAMGYAESDDGVSWTPHPENPILTGDDLPFATGFQTPFVLFDPDDEIFKMWFVVVVNDDPNQQAMSYATSRDGLDWEIHSKTYYPSIRRPMVFKTGSGEYRMWGNSSPGDGTGGLFTRIYEFTSSDGLNWTRREEPAIQPSDRIKSCVYPFVIRDKGGYRMWYGGHIDGGMFELFCATSKDGTAWQTDHENSVFAAAPGNVRFDSRYTSTPCIVIQPDRYLLYYSARDWNRDYVDKDGKAGRDGASPYSHIGVAVIPREREN